MKNEKDFEINGVEGITFFNTKFNKFQVNIESRDFDLVDEFKRFDTEEEMNEFLNSL